MESIKRVCGNCFDYENGKCRVRDTIKDGKREPKKVSKNRNGCEVFMLK